MANPGRSVNKTILVRNRQRSKPIDARFLQKIGRALTTELLKIKSFDLAIYVVDAREMTRLNETFLQHCGSTDVLAFDYSGPDRADRLCAEIFLCLDEAVIQAVRFRTNWQSELIRYLVHALLHLQGYDDSRVARRLKMKRAENQLLTKLSRTFPFSELAATRESRLSKRTSRPKLAQ